jgi:hypothetical protein
LLAAEGQKLANDLGRVGSALLDFADALPCRLGNVARCQLISQQLGIAADRGKHIVEVVCHASSEAPQGLELARLAQVLFALAQSFGAGLHALLQLHLCAAQLCLDLAPFGQHMGKARSELLDLARPFARQLRIEVPLGRCFRRARQATDGQDDAARGEKCHRCREPEHADRHPQVEQHQARLQRARMLCVDAHEQRAGAAALIGETSSGKIVSVPHVHGLCARQRVARALGLGEIGAGRERGRLQAIAIPDTELQSKLPMQIEQRGMIEGRLDQQRAEQFLTRVEDRNRHEGPHTSAAPPESAPLWLARVELGLAPEVAVQGRQVAPRHHAIVGIDDRDPLDADHVDRALREAEHGKLLPLGQGVL